MYTYVINLVAAVPCSLWFMPFALAVPLLGAVLHTSLDHVLPSTTIMLFMKLSLLLHEFLPPRFLETPLRTLQQDPSLLLVNLSFQTRLLGWQKLYVYLSVLRAYTGYSMKVFGVLGLFLPCW